MRAYYSDSLGSFLRTDAAQVRSALADRSEMPPTDEQKRAWQEQLVIMARELRKLDCDNGNGSGHVYLEFVIPRMGKRADAVIIYGGVVFVLEFKIGEGQYRRADMDQCTDYAVDLKNFHEGSHDKPILPILVASGAGATAYGLDRQPDGVFGVVRSDGSNLSEIIHAAAEMHAGRAPIDPLEWEDSAYKPTPTIIEAARALYNNHDVRDITRSEAGAENLTSTKSAVEGVIEYSKKNGRKSICFVTGIPGAGKTLVGLNLTVKPRDGTSSYSGGGGGGGGWGRGGGGGDNDGNDAGSIFLSGNGPLVNVLREALARDKYDRERSNRARDPTLARVTKREAYREAAAIIQPVREFITEAMDSDRPPHERVVVFDEAQRAWSRKELDRFMKKRKGREIGMSQPEYVISAMDRHRDWAVLVCLVGGGQEINHGEAGLPEWFDSVRRSHPGWDVYVSPEINGEEYLGRNYDDGRGRIEDMLGGIRPRYRAELHLATSIRSFRSRHVSEFIRLLLDLDAGAAGSTLSGIGRYPIMVTRDFGRAKRWLQRRARGTERFGIVAAAKSYRLRPHGIYVELTPKATHWFLNPPDDPRSSNGLEYVATEFEIQGLELDWVCVAWDADLRYTEDGWNYKEFVGDRWNNIHKDHKQRYLKNAYRVLLTRARQGMVIFVPPGDDRDGTRDPGYYDRTYEYLRGIGIPELACQEVASR